MRYLFFLAATLATMASFAQDPVVEVRTEEAAYPFVNPNNGSGPLWSYGCSPIARLGEEVYLCQMETGEGVPPLANTRWRLLHRESSGWKLLAEEEGYREREPGVLARLSDTTLLLNVNVSQEAPGVKYGKAEPCLLQFMFGEQGFERKKLSPAWAGQPYFTDHSYRGFAADPETGQVLMLNIDAKTSVENACLLSKSGETLGTGAITFPIRACYPQVQLRRGAAHVLAVGDIVEPVEAWKTYKFEQTQREWDYVFRVLYFTSTPQVGKEPFAPPMEVANVDATGGSISNKDLWVDDQGEAFILYTEQEVQSALLRDKFFPGKSIIPSLKLAVVRDGKVSSRETLIAGSETRGLGDARFQVMPDGSLYVVVYVTGPDAGIKLLRVPAGGAEAKLIPVPLTQPMSNFLLASAREGNLPSKRIDMMGMRDSNTVGYACFELK